MVPVPLIGIHANTVISVQDATLQSKGNLSQIMVLIGVKRIILEVSFLDKSDLD